MPTLSDSEAEPNTAPVVSIILPTYNRARFLPEAIESIRSQQFTHWELIVVDDGSTDETPELIEQLTADIWQPVRFIRQENQGPYAARNTGLDHAAGRYIAFFDSDDLWLPHHLNDCVESLEANPHVDWVYGACRIVDEATGTVVADSTFYVDGKPRPFLQLDSRQRGPLRIIEDRDAFRCMILHGLYNGLQNSLWRASSFAQERFDAVRRNEAEDQLAVLRTIADGKKIGYLDSVHVVYRIHADNSSGAATKATVERRRRVLEEVIVGFERLPHDVALSRSELVALHRRLNREYFWHLGYSVLFANGLRLEALPGFSPRFTPLALGLAMLEDLPVGKASHANSCVDKSAMRSVGSNQGGVECVAQSSHDVMNREAVNPNSWVLVGVAGLLALPLLLLIDSLAAFARGWETSSRIDWFVMSAAAVALVAICGVIACQPGRSFVRAACTAAIALRYNGCGRVAGRGNIRYRIRFAHGERVSPSAIARHRICLSPGARGHARNLRRVPLYRQLLGRAWARITAAQLGLSNSLHRRQHHRMPLSRRRRGLAPSVDEHPQRTPRRTVCVGRKPWHQRVFHRRSSQVLVGGHSLDGNGLFGVHGWGE